MDVKTKYNTLALFQSKKHRQGMSYAIHKKIDFSKLKEKRNYADINNWLADQYPLKSCSTLLDAGCGVGETLFIYRSKSKILGTGISLSETEIELANNALYNIGLEKDINFRVCSFDEKLGETFDQIIAIESLKHSVNLAGSIENLVRHLNTDGKIILVEDCRVTKAGKLPFKEVLLKQWSLKELYTSNDYTRVLDKLGLSKVQIHDFTTAVKSRSVQYSRLLTLLFGFASKLPFPPAIRKMAAIFQAGFVLEYYYSAKKMKYKVIVYQKDHL